jgi:hypothetical protein
VCELRIATSFACAVDGLESEPAQGVISRPERNQNTVSNETNEPKDAATEALDAIAKLCGCEQWDYPGQVVRDVEAALSRGATPQRTVEFTPGQLKELMEHAGAYREDGYPQSAKLLTDAAVIIRERLWMLEAVAKVLGYRQGTPAVIRRVQNLVDRERAQWIKCSERRPSAGELVHFVVETASGGRWCECGYFDTTQWMRAEGSEQYSLDEVTMWQPTPRLP